MQGRIVDRMLEPPPPVLAFETVSRAIGVRRCGNPIKLVRVYSKHAKDLHSRRASETMKLAVYRCYRKGQI